MKRFFKPVEKDGSSKKPTISAASLVKEIEIVKETAAVDEDKNEITKKDPLKFLTWNANSFLLRVKNDWPEFSKFIENYDPDVIAIQVF